MDKTLQPNLAENTGPFNKIRAVLQNKTCEVPPPIWFMRQAGRYLPEYRAERLNHPDFMNFCFTPEAVVKVTLQPIERFDFDAAIIFSDILTIPHLLGQKVAFHEGVGPVLEAVDWPSFLDGAEQDSLCHGLRPVLKAIGDVRRSLAPEKALIGFCGSPWTVATYMINGGKNKTFEATLRFAYENAAIFQRLLKILEHHIAQSLVMQIETGCDVVQIFDSWASVVPDAYKNGWLFEPVQRICQTVWAAYPDVPIIYYGRGISDHYAGLEKKVPDLCFGVDEQTDLSRLTLSNKTAFQGNLGPVCLAEGTFEKEVHRILKQTQGKPFVFNLGHGILPSTPIDNVHRVLELVRGKSS